MIETIIILAIVIVGVIGIISMIKKKVSCTCIGKPCGSDDGCGNQCCDPTQNQSCVNGKCCDNSCEGLTCQDTNGCGNSCEQILCPNGGICQDDGTCCYQSDCPIGSCQIQCGKPCPCPNGGQCVNGSCCIPQDCSTGICNTPTECGQECTCNNDYCKDGCCQDSLCTYENICQSGNDNFNTMLYKTWGRFCSPATNGQLGSTCQNCQLVSPTWLDVDGQKAIAPLSGTIKCDTCQNNQGEFVKANPVEIEPGVTYYENINGVITSGPVDNQYCKTIGCSNCFCHNDADCQRWGCTSCIGETCQ